MPLRFDFIVQKLKRRADAGPKLAFVGGKAVRPAKTIPAETPDVVEPLQVEAKRRKTA